MKDEMMMMATQTTSTRRTNFQNEIEKRWKHEEVLEKQELEA